MVLRLGLLLMEASRAKPLAGQPVTLFLILGQRKQDDRWVKLDETLRSHSPSKDGHLQKRLPAKQAMPLQVSIRCAA
ncbi:hypothetical protein C1886_21900 [Pseudomonas sp. FW300-N1A1]|nr:hypothetical protein C1886_21900 [Pseudomonas sp. FW300-N1A1]